MRKMKRKFLILTLVLSMTITGAAGFGCVVNAANTSDRTYSFSNTVAFGYTSWDSKKNSSRVDVYPLSGPKIYYTVYGGWESAGTANEKCSNRVAIPAGVYANITNTVKEKGFSRARLRLDTITLSNMNTKFMWKSDSERNGTIFD